jgi:hypothetical protein
MRVPPTTAVLALACLALAAAARAAGDAGDAECAAWPGEPAPLPTISDPDFLRAEWARLRASELARVARRLESSDPVESERLWRHAECLDPASAEIAAGAVRAALAQHAGPPAAPAPPAPPSPDAAAPSAPRYETAATETRALTPPVEAAPPAPDPCRTGAEGCPRLREADRSLARADTLLRDARFDESLKSQQRARSVLDGLPSSTATRARRARLEVLAATVHVARGHDARARASFERALVSDPALRLDPSTTSPKVLRAFDSARASAADQASR